MTRTQPRVLIADDHVPTRVGVRTVLEEDGIIVCAEAGTAGEAIDAALREHPDVCLLDVHMPGDGTAAASVISSHLPDTVVLMLTVSRDDADLFEALRRGASGYLLKDMDVTELPGAIRGALEGEAALPGKLAARLIEEFHDRPTARKTRLQTPSGPALTAREWEVLELMCEEVGTAEIARRLYLSKVTVRRHVSSIVHKLGATSREDAVRRALGQP